MTKLHERTFRAAPDDVERDELLAVRCTGLGFVQPQHLEVPDGIVDEGCLARAAAELNRMNNFKVGRGGEGRAGEVGGSGVQVSSAIRRRACSLFIIAENE